MASIRKQIQIDTKTVIAWDSLRDFGAPHERLAGGFVTDTQLDGRDRIVNFFNGSVARERLVALDDEARRLVWSVLCSPEPRSPSRRSRAAHRRADGARP